jgi:hypothetical protein
MKVIIALLLLSLTGCGVVFHAEKVTFGIATDNEGLAHVSEVAKSPN